MSEKTTIKRDSIISKTIKSNKTELSMLVVLVAILGLMHAITGRALTARNITNILQATTPYLIMSMGQLMIIITAGIDLSVGSMFSLSGMIGTLVMINYGIVPGFLAALATGLLCGAINGFLVAKIKMAPFIVTLAMTSIASSLTFIIAGGNSQTVNRPEYTYLNKGTMIPGIPNYILFMVILVVIMQFVLKKSVFGRWVYAVGSNEEAARLVGVPTKLVKMIAYTITGLLSAFAAMMNASYLMTVECTAGTGMEMTVIAATVIGGASMSGGTGTPLGTTIGALILIVISNGINLMGINSFWNGTVTGVILVVAVLAGTLSASRRNANIRK